MEKESEEKIGRKMIKSAKMKMPVRIFRDNASPKNFTEVHFFLVLEISSTNTLFIRQLVKKPNSLYKKKNPNKEREKDQKVNANLRSKLKRSTT